MNNNYYSKAKVVILYKNGCEQEPKEFVIKPYIRTWHELLVEITKYLQPTFEAVEYLFCAKTGLEVKYIYELEHRQKYIALGKKYLKCLQDGYFNIPEFLSKTRKNLSTNSQLLTKRQRCNVNITIIYVFRNGIKSFRKKFVLTHYDLDKWVTTLRFIAKTLGIGMGGECILYTTTGKHIKEPWQLQDRASYVAAGYKEPFILKSYEKYFAKLKDSKEPESTRIGFKGKKGCNLIPSETSISQKEQLENIDKDITYEHSIDSQDLLESALYNNIDLPTKDEREEEEMSGNKDKLAEASYEYEYISLSPQNIEGMLHQDDVLSADPEKFSFSDKLSIKTSCMFNNRDADEVTFDQIMKLKSYTNSKLSSENNKEKDPELEYLEETGNTINEVFLNYHTILNSQNAERCRSPQQNPDDWNHFLAKYQKTANPNDMNFSINSSCKENYHDSKLGYLPQTVVTSKVFSCIPAFHNCQNNSTEPKQVKSAMLLTNEEDNSSSYPNSSISYTKFEDLCDSKKLDYRSNGDSLNNGVNSICAYRMQANVCPHVVKPSLLKTMNAAPSCRFCRKTDTPSMIPQKRKISPRTKTAKRPTKEDLCKAMLPEVAEVSKDTCLHCVTNLKPKPRRFRKTTATRKVHPKPPESPDSDYEGCMCHMSHPSEKSHRPHKEELDAAGRDAEALKTVKCECEEDGRCISTGESITQELPPSQEIPPTQEITSSQEIPIIQEITPSQEMAPYQEITQEMTPSQKVTPLQEITHTQEITSSQELAPFQEMTPSQECEEKVIDQRDECVQASNDEEDNESTCSSYSCVDITVINVKHISDTDMIRATPVSKIENLRVLSPKDGKMKNKHNITNDNVCRVECVQQCLVECPAKTKPNINKSVNDETLLTNHQPISGFHFTVKNPDSFDVKDLTNRMNTIADISNNVNDEELSNNHQPINKFNFPAKNSDSFDVKDFTNRLNTKTDIQNNVSDEALTNNHQPINKFNFPIKNPDSFDVKDFTNKLNTKIDIQNNVNDESLPNNHQPINKLQFPVKNPDSFDVKDFTNRLNTKADIQDNLNDEALPNNHQRINKLNFSVKNPDSFDVKDFTNRLNIKTDIPLLSSKLNYVFQVPVENNFCAFTEQKRVEDNIVTTESHVVETSKCEVQYTLFMKTVAEIVDSGSDVAGKHMAVKLDQAAASHIPCDPVSSSILFDGKIDQSSKSNLDCSVATPPETSAPYINSPQVKSELGVQVSKSFLSLWEPTYKTAKTQTEFKTTAEYILGLVNKLCKDEEHMNTKLLVDYSKENTPSYTETPTKESSDAITYTQDDLSEVEEKAKAIKVKGSLTMSRPVFVNIKNSKNQTKLRK